MRRLSIAILLAASLAGTLSAQEKPALSPITRAYVAIDAKVIALQHVRVIDGTGAPAPENQTVIIRNGNIREIGPDGSVKIPEGAKIIDLSGHSVIPGRSACMNTCSIPQLRAADRFPTLPRSLTKWVSVFRGCISPVASPPSGPQAVSNRTQIWPKKLIDTGEQPGPKMHITSPYLEGLGSFVPHSTNSPAPKKSLAW